ncbi:MAG: YhgE/Pip family protein [Rhodoglobus sp.]
MKIVPLVRSEFARLTASRMGITALIALMVVPVIYGGLYLWGNADPYSQFDKVPAALVVDDAGATVDGATVNYGRDAATSLLDDERFGWVEVSDSAAKAGVRDGTYDFVLAFPNDFSADIASAAHDDPTPAALQLTTNDTNSYLSTTLAKQAAEAVRVSIAQKIGERGSRALLDAVGSIRTGLVDASGGGARLSSGAAVAASGAASLATGTATLSAGASALAVGLGTLNSSAAALPASASALAAGASSVSSGLSGAASAADSLEGSAAKSAALASTARAQIETELTTLGVSSVDEAAILGQLDGVAASTAQTGGIAAGLAPNISALSTEAAQVSSGAGAVAASAPTLASAVSSAASGASALSAGAADAAAGATTLSGGLTELAAGSARLDHSLAKGVSDVPSTTAASRAATAAALANPVDVSQTAVTAAANYGAGLAPFFISLAAWIGIYALFLLVRPLSRRALTAVRHPIRTTLAGWATPALLGAGQMLALFAVVTLVLGLHPANALGLLGFMVLVSVTFAAIVLALNVWLGSVGQFLALLLMIVQLVVAGGTFPWQTLPAPLAALHQALPMSHAVEGVRQLLYGGSPFAVLSAVVPLLFWLAGGLAFSALGALKQGRYRTLRDLRPSPLAG